MRTNNKYSECLLPKLIKLIQKSIHININVELHTEKEVAGILINKRTKVKTIKEQYLHRKLSNYILRAHDKSKKIPESHVTKNEKRRTVN